MKIAPFGQRERTVHRGFELPAIATFPRQPQYGIYFLLLRGEIVYVGRSTTSISRPLSHLEKEWDTCKYLACPLELLESLESYLIQLLRPRLNKWGKKLLRGEFTQVPCSKSVIDKIVAEVRGVAVVDSETRPPIFEEDCGFDYAQSVRELNQRFSYEKIARFCGYASRRSVINLLDEVTVPSHTQGEALYILYVETFGRKPPKKKVQPTAQVVA